MAEQLGAEPVLVDRTADPGAIEQFLCLEGSGYKAAAGLAMTTHSGEPEFFAAMCRGLRGRIVSICSLEAGGQHWRCACGFEIVKAFSSTRSATRNVMLATDPEH